jgi:hypothetical protein
MGNLYTYRQHCKWTISEQRSSDLTIERFRFDTATIKEPLTNQMRLIYPINQSHAY